MEPIDGSGEDLRLKLNQETARIAWADLQRFFAQGTLIWVRDGLDLVEVALWVARDDAQAIMAEMNKGRIAPATDEQARRWHATQADLWAVVVKPWILVQDIRCASGSTPTPVQG